MNALEKLLEFIEDTKMDAKITRLEAILEQDSDLVDLAEGYLIDAEDLRKLSVQDKKQERGCKVM